MYKSSILILVMTINCHISLSSQYSLASGHDHEIAKLHVLISQSENTLDDHCEVPCGIYGDSLRISLIKEHSSTIEKAMNSINKLSKEESVNYNQLIRWVNNKEKHAEEIQGIIAQYFLHQRVKLVKTDLPKDKMGAAKTKYHNQLGSLHEALVAAMKCKQTTDLNNVAALNSAVSDFESFYFHGHKH